MILNRKEISVKVIMFTCLLYVQACGKIDESYELDPEPNNSEIQLFQLPLPEVIYSDTTLRRVLDEELALIKKNKTVRLSSKDGMRIIKKNPKKVYVHYMPWFQSKDFDGRWGQHWTMGNRDPDHITDHGLREIASYFDPLIGPYSSIDPALHEYHFLLMKLAGVDGVIFNWYGSRNIHDYGMIKDATEKFIPELENIDLEFSIMYEDRVATMENSNVALNPVQRAKEDFQYILDSYFTSPSYMKHKGTNVISIFGPKYLTVKEQWDDIFSIFPPNGKPALISLWATKHVLGEQGKGEFLWVSKDHLAAQNYYYENLGKNNGITIGSAYPGFKSFYEEGGWIEGMNSWILPMKDGVTFIETLNNSSLEAADFIQVITWNDFGEGTMIEPTAQFGFKYLSILQKYTGVPYNEKDLSSVVRLYQARKKYRTNEEVMQLLDQAYSYIKKLKIKRTNMLLQAIDRFYG